MMRLKNIYIFCIFVLTFINAEERTLKPEVNPGCAASGSRICNSSKLIYVRGDNHNTSIHYVWDFNRKPTFLMALTPLTVNMSVNWSKFEHYESNSITFTAPATYIFGVILDQIYEFNDTNDTGILPISSGKSIKPFDSGGFKWEISKLLDDIAAEKVMYSVKGTVPNNDVNNTTNGSVSVNLYAFGKSGHGSALPRLAHTENSSQIDIILDEFGTSFTNARFAVQFIYFSTDSPTAEFALSAKKIIDDENSPGIFVLDTMTVDDRDKNSTTAITPRGSVNVHGFMQWKPVVYTACDKNIANSTQVIQYAVHAVNTTDHSETLNATLLPLLSINQTTLMVKAENISFGYQSDGFYRKTGYLSWSFVVGIGSPPSESFSMIVILVLSIGLGLPVLVIVVGAAYFAYRKLSMHRENLFFVR